MRRQHRYSDRDEPIEDRTGHDRTVRQHEANRTDRQAGRQTDRQTERQPDRQTDRDSEADTLDDADRQTAKSLVVLPSGSQPWFGEGVVGKQEDSMFSFSKSEPGVLLADLSPPP